MKRYGWFRVSALVLIVLVGVWLWLALKSPVGPKETEAISDVSAQKQVQRLTTPPSEESSSTPGYQEQQAKFLSAFLTPIDFFGKVTDDSGNPVGGARVEFGANDKPFQTGSTYVKSSSDDGTFSISGIRGIALSVVVSKDGFHTTVESRGNFNYTKTPEQIKADRDLQPAPSHAKPAIFVLRRKGEVAAKLFQLNGGQYDLIAGKSVEVNLKSGRIISSGQGDLKIDLILDGDLKSRYSWSFRLTATGSGAGIVIRDSEVANTAPEQGYETTKDIKSSQANWSESGEGRFFVRLADGCYSRIDIRAYTGTRNFVVLEGFTNPAPNDRSLEFEPKKTTLVQ